MDHLSGVRACGTAGIAASIIPLFAPKSLTKKSSGNNSIDYFEGGNQAK
jgi:hypothetical protein